MAFQHGKVAFITIDAVDITAFTDNQSLARVIALAETTSFGNDDATSIAGVRSHTITLSGGWDPTLDAAMVAADDGSSVAFVANPEGNTSGDVTYTGSCFIENYTWNAGVTDKVTWNASFTVTGAVARSTV